MANDTLSGAGTGAATGAAIGSVVPGIGTAIGAVGGAIVGGVAGALKGRKRRKEKEKLDKLLKQSPKYEVNEEAFQNQALARSQAFGRDRAIQMREQQLEQDTANAVTDAKDITTGTSSLLSTIAAIQANKDVATRSLAQDEASLRANNMRQLMAVNNAVIDEKDKAWNFNQNMPFQMKVAALRDRIKSNEEQSAQEAANANSSIMGMAGGGFGGGGFSSAFSRGSQMRSSSGGVGQGWVPSDLNKAQ